MIKLRTKYALDARDEQLIRLLSNNSRATLKELQVEIGISHQAIKKRLRALEDAGIIKAYTVFINWDLVVDVSAEEIERREAWTRD